MRLTMKKLKTSSPRDLPPHMKYMPPVGRVKGVYGAQNGITIVSPKKQVYDNAINIREGRDALCIECSTPTDTRETGWVDGAPVVEQVCPKCKTVHVPVIIQL